MRNIRTLSAFVALGSLVACTAAAGSDTEVDGKAEALEGETCGSRQGFGHRAHVAHLAETLALTDAQQADAEAIFREPGSFHDHAASLRAILTPDQIARFETVVAGHEARPGHRPSNASSRADRLRTHLDLNAQQHQDVLQVFETHAGRLSELHAALREHGASKSAPDQAKFEALRAEARGVKQAIQGRLETILTPAQLEEYRALQSHHGSGHGPGSCGEAGAAAQAHCGCGGNDCGREGDCGSCGGGCPNAR